MELIILIGVQACGKSTFYHDKFINTHVRLNLDMLKTRNREKILFEACLKSKTKTVIDNTNTTIEERKEFIKKAKEHKFKIIGYYFSVKIDEVIERNKKRENKVPEIAILGTYKKLRIPSLDEGFEELYYVTSEENGFEIKEWKNEV